MNYKKYRSFSQITNKNREWPENKITNTPVWCSVDLRDGNQSLIDPMDIKKKIKMFKLLKKMGYKEIEVGFPSASDTEFLFIRKLIEENHIPDDVTISVLTQAREHLIRKTIESLKGAKKAIIHFYNSTSPLQREVVFSKSKNEIIEIAVQGAALIKNLTDEIKGTEFRFEYSPESFSQTEIEFSVDICKAVIKKIKPDKKKKIILNLPATVECSTPNIYADQIEVFRKMLNDPERTIISVHTHNDRGTGVAATELSLLAGAERVEGTLFGNGERTGNADLVALGMNLYSQGINPEIVFDPIDEIIEVYQNCTGLNVHQRHPYAGELVFAAFSGSHQDAIRKGLKSLKDKNKEWSVPYLPIDPADISRKYEAVIRINSQSGKGGVAYVMENEFGYKMPKNMHPEFSEIVKKETDRNKKEITAEKILEIFEEEYINKNYWSLIGYETEAQFNFSENTGQVNLKAIVKEGMDEHSIEASDEGSVSAFFKAVKPVIGFDCRLTSYSEHSLGEGVKSEAAAYVELNNEGKSFFGAGIDKNITIASIKAILSAINRIQDKRNYKLIQG